MGIHVHNNRAQRIYFGERGTESEVKRPSGMPKKGMGKENKDLAEDERDRERGCERLTIKIR